MKRGIRGHGVERQGLPNICQRMREMDCEYIQLVLERSLDEFKKEYGLGDDVDYTDEKALHDAIAEAVKTIAKLYNIEYKAQEFKISYDDVADYAVNSRTMVAYFYGYRTFCTALKELGTSIEVFDEMCLMYAYEDMLSETYNYKQPDDVELTPAIEIFEDAWADVTIEDIAMG